MGSSRKELAKKHGVGNKRGDAISRHPRRKELIEAIYEALAWHHDPNEDITFTWSSLSRYISEPELGFNIKLHTKHLNILLQTHIGKDALDYDTQRDSQETQQP